MPHKPQRKAGRPTSAAPRNVRLCFWLTAAEAAELLAYRQQFPVPPKVSDVGRAALLAFLRTASA